MKNYKNYKYPEPIKLENREWPSNNIQAAPYWNSVDLRDGNQALPVPMDPEKKREYFKMLTDIGFKEIELAFPAASKDDFDFVRSIIEKDLIPDDVYISVLTQAREHLIYKTVEALKGVKKGILHCYIAASDLHSNIVFNKSREDVKNMAIEGTKKIVEALEAENMRDRICLQFSPEEFTDSDVDFVIDVCENVKEIWGSPFPNSFIVNLPATVERRPPNHYADMIEYFCKNFKYRDESIISLHAHNDQGCAIAATELALLAGADRVEGTLFGHGERTGNVDLVAFALNLYSRGIDIGLDFSNLPEIAEKVEKASGIPVHPRHPYAGELVFTAFSGSHQDAIRKGINKKDDAAKLFGVNWKVPYLHINPNDIGRKYENLIRINSQSGKGGAAYVLEKDYGLNLPAGMHSVIGNYVQQLADTKGNEITSGELYEIFKDHFLNLNSPYRFESIKRLDSDNKNKISVELTISINGKEETIRGIGNGPVSAVTHGLQESEKIVDFRLEDYQEQSLGHSADAEAMAFVSILNKEKNKNFFGAGEDSNIDKAAIKALISALNNSL